MLSPIKRSAKFHVIVVGYTQVKRVAQSTLALRSKNIRGTLGQFVSTCVENYPVRYEKRNILISIVMVVPHSGTCKSVFSSSIASAHCTIIYLHMYLRLHSCILSQKVCNSLSSYLFIVVFCFILFFVL